MPQSPLAIAISMENHGPYDDAGRVADPKAMAGIALPAGLDAAGAGELRNYLHLHNADREFGRLLMSLRARQRPFVLLFFGDHLPALGDVYDRLGFADGAETGSADGALGDGGQWRRRRAWRRDGDVFLAVAVDDPCARRGRARRYVFRFRVADRPRLAGCG